MFTLHFVSFCADRLCVCFYNPQRWSVPSRFPRWRAVSTRASCRLPRVATPLTLNSPSGRCPFPRSPWIEATPQVLYQHPLPFFPIFFLPSSICYVPLLNSWCHAAFLSFSTLTFKKQPCSFFILISLISLLTSFALLFLPMTLIYACFTSAAFDHIPEKLFSSHYLRPSLSFSLLYIYFLWFHRWPCRHSL